MTEVQFVYQFPHRQMRKFACFSLLARKHPDQILQSPQIETDIQLLGKLQEMKRGFGFRFVAMSSISREARIHKLLERAFQTREVNPATERFGFPQDCGCRLT